MPKRTFKISPKFERGKRKNLSNFARQNLYVKLPETANQYFDKKFTSKNITF